MVLGLVAGKLCCHYSERKDSWSDLTRSSEDLKLKTKLLDFWEMLLVLLFFTSWLSCCHIVRITAVAADNCCLQFEAKLKLS